MRRWLGFPSEPPKELDAGVMTLLNVQCSAVFLGRVFLAFNGLKIRRLVGWVAWKNCIARILKRPKT
jgi:energy-converting hydrogenase Eha subunit E